MPPKKADRDGFNFDSLYASMGADALVKKPLSELKKATPSPVPKPAVVSMSSGSASAQGGISQTNSATVATAKPAVAVKLDAGALDFLSSMSSTKNKTPAPAFMHPETKAKPKIDHHSDDMFSAFNASTAPKPAASVATSASGHADPFDAFGDVHGALPAVSSGQHTVHPGGLSAEDDLFGFSSVPASRSAPSAPDFENFDTFVSPPPSSPPSGLSQMPSQPHSLPSQPCLPQATAAAVLQPHHTHTAQPPFPSSKKAEGSRLQTTSSDHEWSSDYQDSTGARVQTAVPLSQLPVVGGHNPAGPDTTWASSSAVPHSSPGKGQSDECGGAIADPSKPVLPRTNPGQTDTWGGAHDAGVRPVDTRAGSRGAQPGLVGAQAGPVDVGWGRTPAAEQEWDQWEEDQRQQKAHRFSSTAGLGVQVAKHQEGPAGPGGMMGMLRGFGKRAVKAAQASLANMEAALERIDQGPLSLQPPSTPPVTATTPPPNPGFSRNMRRHSDTSSNADQEDDPATLAVMLLGLHADDRPAALARLPVALRPTVEMMLAQLVADELPEPLLHSNPARGYSTQAPVHPAKPHWSPGTRHEPQSGRVHSSSSECWAAAPAPDGVGSGRLNPAPVLRSSRSGRAVDIQTSAVDLPGAPRHSWAAARTEANRGEAGSESHSARQHSERQHSAQQQAQQQAQQEAERQAEKQAQQQARQQAEQQAAQQVRQLAEKQAQQQAEKQAQQQAEKQAQQQAQAQKQAQQQAKHEEDLLGGFSHRGGTDHMATTQGSHTAATHPHAPPPHTQPVPSHLHSDLLGLDGGSPSHAASTSASSYTATAAPPPPNSQSRPVVGNVEDTHDFFSGGVSTPAPVPSSQPHPVVGNVDDMHDFFAGGPPAPSPPPVAKPARASTSSSPSARPTASTTSAAAPKASTARPGTKGPALMDLSGAWGESAEVDVSAHQGLYVSGEGGEQEPELRRQLREARIADKHSKMKAALAGKLAADTEEARRREEQVTFKDKHKAVVDVWRNRNKGNIRGLLGSLHTVMWEGSDWQPVSVGDVLEKPQIRKVWMRANLLVHPDKVRQRNGSAEQVAIADMIFDALKDAWNAYLATGK